MFDTRSNAPVHSIICSHPVYITQSGNQKPPWKSISDCVGQENMQHRNLPPVRSAAIHQSHLHPLGVPPSISQPVVQALASAFAVEQTAKSLNP